MRCPRCSALMETWPHDIVPFCTYCGYELARRKTDRPKLDMGDTMDGMEENNGHHSDTDKQNK